MHGQGSGLSMKLPNQKLAVVMASLRGVPTGNRGSVNFPIP
jgi:hypothetical protein